MRGLTTYTDTDSDLNEISFDQVFRMKLKEADLEHVCRKLAQYAIEFARQDEAFMIVWVHDPQIDDEVIFEVLTFKDEDKLRRHSEVDTSDMFNADLTDEEALGRLLEDKFAEKYEPPQSLKI